MSSEVLRKNIIMRDLMIVDKMLTDIVEAAPYSNGQIPQLRLARLITASECIRKELTDIGKECTVRSDSDN